MRATTSCCSGLVDDAIAARDLANLDAVVGGAVIGDEFLEREHGRATSTSASSAPSCSATADSLTN